MPEEERRVDVSVLAERVGALDRHVKTELGALKELMTSQRDADQLAIKTALDASHELAAKHNDLIRLGERKEETYATKIEVKRVESWQNKVTGGLVVVSVIGIVNLVKLFAG
jgi:hypothetical protein